MQPSKRLVLLFLVLTLPACRGRKDAPAVRQPSDAGKGTASSTAADFWADTGRVIDRGLASYAIIADTECPGSRLVKTHFEILQGLIVRITESTLQRDCHEGARTDFTVMVHDTKGALVDSIVGYAHDLRVINDDRDAGGDPLLQGDEYGGGSGPRELHYWNLRTGQSVFQTEVALQSFVANGKVRYLAASGGNGDTLGIIEYGDSRGSPQRVVFTRGLPAGTQSGANFQIQHDTLEGPRSNGRVVLGTTNDTVPIRGITLRLRVGDVYLSAGGLTLFDLAATIVDDRLVALPISEVK